MLLLEIFSEVPKEYNDLKNDDTQLEITDTRKTRLTLAHINSLRKMNDLRTLEHSKEMERVQAMYGAPPPDAMGGGGMF